MFTGIVTDIGEVVAREDGRFTIRARYPAQELEIGASIACDGCCLTVTPCAPTAGGGVHRRRLERDPVARPRSARGRPAARINLERSLEAGDELGGHIVSGHVDGVARIVGYSEDGESRRFSLRSARAARALHRPERLRGARRHLAHGQRGRATRASASISSP